MKIIVSILTIALSFAFGNASVSELQKMPFFINTGIKVLEVHDAKSLYIVRAEHKRGAQKQVIQFFVTKDKKVVLQGQAFNENVAQLEMPVDIKPFVGTEAFKIGTGSKKYFVWTDPECPYCKKMKRLIVENKLLDKATFYFYFLPLDFHKDAKEMSRWIISHKTAAQKWNALLAVSNGTDKGAWKGYNAKATKAVIDKVEENIQGANSIGVTGTPTVYDLEGNKINWGQLPQILK